MGTPSNRIWRTVVFAGAMLATPLAGCGSGTHKAESTGPRCDATCKRDAEATAAANEQARRDAEARLAADEQAKRDADLIAQRQAEEDARKAAEEEAARKVAEEEAARKAEEEQRRMDQIQRARGSGKGVRGRGFVLA